jgi:hypothetical protein
MKTASPSPESPQAGNFSPSPSSPARVTLSRKAGWRMPQNTVKVCRPTKYGNPHRVGWCPVCGIEHTQAEAVAEFRALLELAEIPADLSELRGKNLACWCKAGTPCHADVLLRLANVSSDLSLLASGAEGAQALSVPEVPKGQGLGRLAR